MKSDAISFHHPLAFWTGCVLLAVGVLAHGPMLAMAAHMHYRLAGMSMDAPMLVGMAMIPLGLALAAYGLLPRLARMRRLVHPDAAAPVHGFAATDDAPLNRAHWTLVLVLVVALAVDVMKPATLGFVLPGLTVEYGIGTRPASLLVLVALTGTALGSLMWGRLGDVFGRRAAILLAALMFMGTAICGAMPAFGWNLAMCFLMGLSAGGLLPMTFTLMAETVPARHRGWLLVALGAVGTAAGYLLAAGAAALLEARFSWRALWLLGLPTGAVIIVLNHWIPESPRFLVSVGLERAAHAVSRNFAGRHGHSFRPPGERSPVTQVLDHRARLGGPRAIFGGRHGPITAGLLAAGLAWGLANFGFLLWLPVNLVSLGVDPGAVNGLLARSALFALPGMSVVIWLYHAWSSIRSLVLFALLTAASLLGFVITPVFGLDPALVTGMATVALLVSASGVIAMLVPYAAEVYPVHLRGTGAGLVAAGSKFGGILGAGLGLLGFFEHIAWSAATIAVAMIVAAWLLARSGVETRARRLEDIENGLVAPDSGTAGRRMPG